MALKVGRGETGHVYVDVDGTLLLWPGKTYSPTAEERDAFGFANMGLPHKAELLPTPNHELIRELRSWHSASVDGILVIWSRNGRGHAVAAAKFCGLNDCNPVCLGKPDVAIDDKPNLWGTHPLNVVAPDAFKVPR